MADYITLATVKARLGITDSTDDTQLGLYITAASRAIDRWCKRADSGFVAVTETRIFDVFPVATGYLGSIDGIARAAIVPIDPLLTATAVATDQDGDGVYETVWNASAVPPDFDFLPVNGGQDGRPFTLIRTPDRGSKFFTVGPRRLQIAGTWGETTTVPPVIQEAAFLVILRWFKRKDAPFGIFGGPEMGMTKLVPMDPDVKAMLEYAGYIDNWFLA